MKKCECKTLENGDEVYGDIDTDIAYCPLHAAAEEMLKALKEVHWLTRGPSYEKQDSIMVDVLVAISRAERKP